MIYSLYKFIKEKFLEGETILVGVVSPFAMTFRSKGYLDFVDN